MRPVLAAADVAGLVSNVCRCWARAMPTTVHCCGRYVGSAKVSVLGDITGEGKKEVDLEPAGDEGAEEGFLSMLRGCCGCIGGERCR